MIDIDISAIEIIKDILLPVVLMLAGWLYGRHTKIMDAKDTTIRELTDHVNNLEDNNLDSRLDEVESDIEGLKDQFSEALDKFTATIGEIKDDQDHITKASQLNGRYTHELAIMLMTLSEGIRDQHLDGNITQAIARYRKFEQDVLGDIVSKGIDINVSDKK